VRGPAQSAASQAQGAFDPGGLLLASIRCCDAVLGSELKRGDEGNSTRAGPILGGTHARGLLDGDCCPGSGLSARCYLHIYHGPNPSRSNRS
jgi:hypothetical protein